ncbi:MAG: PEGA domain-containing protein [Myxococcaceae bacterium]|nr:PEGA domain-containing protein [Myxococcaceae bacterium]
MLRVSPASPGRVYRALPGALLALLTLAAAAPMKAFAAEEAPATAPAIKKGTRLVVVELVTPPTMIGLGGQVASAIVRSAQSLGYEVIGPEELQALLGPEGAEALRKCNGQTLCVLSRVRPANAERVVMGSIGRDDKNYLVQLRMVDAASGEVIADIDRQILIASRRFKQDVEEAVPRMLRGEREARGTLRITANVKNVSVWIEGEPAGKTPVEVSLKPGKYEVRLEKKAYLPLKRLATVEANQVTAEEFRLILEPGGVPEEEAALPPLAAATDASTSAKAKGIRVTVPGWVAFGAAVATAGVGGYFGYRSHATEQTLRNGFDSSTHTFAGTRVQALQGQQDARTANLLFGAAGVAAAAGVLFTVFDVGGDLAPATVTPAAGPDGAGMSVEGRF